MRRILPGLLCLGLLDLTASASVVVPLTLQQLVAQADEIFEGDVLDVRSQWRGSGATQRITTSVTFAVRTTFKGQRRVTSQIEVLGGRVGDRALVVEGMSEFSPGDHDIVFLRTAAAQITPIVGFDSGRFRIPPTAAAEERVFRANGAPLISAADVASGGNLRAPRGSAMSVVDFRSAILAEVARQGRP